MKRILSLIISIILVLSICPAVFAEAVRTQETIRVWNADAELTVELTGEAGADVSVVMLKPGISFPTMMDIMGDEIDQDNKFDYAAFDNGVQHIDTAKLDENGKYTFSYTAAEVGVYNIYVKGAEIGCTATNNTAPKVQPDKIYVESWTSGSYKHNDLSYILQLTKAQLDTYGAKAVAESVWEQLKDQPEGRRTIFINRDLSPYTNTTDRGNNRIWWDTGVEVVSEKLDAFFKELSSIQGATVDFLYGDMEHTHSMYEAKESVLAIAEHARYSEFRTELEARGYDFDLDNGTPLSSVSTNTNKYAEPYVTNVQIYNAACADIAHRYFTEAIYEPAVKYFKNIKYAEYDGDARKTWGGKYDLTPRKTYVGGNVAVAGTTAAPPLYSKRTQKFKYDFVYGVPGETGSSITTIDFYSGAGKDFKELQGNIGLYRIAANAIKDGAVAPWVATEAVETTESFTNGDYRAEMIMHVALHNPDRILHYNPGSDKTTTTEEQSEILMTVLDEVNALVAAEDRRSLNADQADLSIPFAISGIYANGRNLWRITPDTEADTTADIEGANKEFAGGGVTVTFPNGTILANTNSEIGYWVETAAGVNPVITYDDSADEEEAVISFYDVKYGQKADLATAEVVDAVASFKGYYGGKGLNFIAAKYDANGRLIDIETKECGILSPYGNAAFIEIGKDLDTDSIRFYLWEDETIRPLATEEM